MEKKRDVTHVMRSRSKSRRSRISKRSSPKDDGNDDDNEGKKVMGESNRSQLGFVNMIASFK